jgi:ankyrin repeat protein
MFLQPKILTAKVLLITFISIAFTTSTFAQSNDQKLIEESQKENSDLTLIKSLISKGVDKNTINKALRISANKAEYELVKLFLENGANPNSENEIGVLPFFIWLGLDKAIEKNYQGKKGDAHYLLYKLAAEEILKGQKTQALNSDGEDLNKKFLDAAKNVTEKEAKDRLEEIRQDYFGTIELLIKHKANINVRMPASHKNKTILRYTIEENQTNTALALINGGADPNYMDDWKLSPLYLAIDADNYYVSEALIKNGANVNYRKDKDTYTPFELALKKGNIKIALQCIENGANIKAVSEKNEHTPMSYACRNGQIEIVKTLFNKGVSINSAIKDNNTPLHYACMKTDNSELIEFLLSKGANGMAKDSEGTTPFHYAAVSANTKDLKLLIQKGANIEAKNNEGITPLHMAAKFGSINNLTYLLSLGADLDAKNNEGKSAYDLAKNAETKKALQDQSKSLVKLVCSDKTLSKEETEAIISKIPNAESDVNTSYLLNSAAYYENWDLIKMLISKGANVTNASKHSWTALHNSCYKGNIEITQLLIDKGANINALTKDKSTPLYLAVQEEKGEIVKLLTDKGADVSICNKNGASPLHMASKTGNVDIINTLLQKGANVNQKTKSNYCPIHEAIKNGQKDAVKVLMDNGADPNIEPKGGYYPIFKAIKEQYYDIVSLLLSYDNTNKDVTDVINHTPLGAAAWKEDIKLARIIIEKGVSVNQKNPNDETALMIAARTNKKTGLIKYLVENGADVKAFSKFGTNVLHYAAENKKPEIMRYLLSKIEDPDLASEDNYTPLMHACKQRNHYDVVKALIDKGADVNAKTKENKMTALLYAAWKTSNADIIHLLLNNKAKKGAKDINKNGVKVYLDENGYYKRNNPIYREFD